MEACLCFEPWAGRLCFVFAIAIGYYGGYRRAAVVRSQTRTMEELLSPYEAMARYVYASYREPFLVHGAATSTEEQLDEIIAQYPTALTER